MSDLHGEIELIRAGDISHFMSFFNINFKIPLILFHHTNANM